MSLGSTRAHSGTDSGAHRTVGRQKENKKEFNRTVRSSARGSSKAGQRTQFELEFMSLNSLAVLLD
jgi:hypothetical protein